MRVFRKHPNIAIISGLTVIVYAVLMINSAGWLMLMGISILMLLTFPLLHLAIKAAALKVERPNLPLLLLGDLSLILAALLRFDVGDGPSWIGATALVYGAGYQQAEVGWLQQMLQDSFDRAILWNAVAYLPLVLMWILTISDARTRALAAPKDDRR